MYTIRMLYQKINGFFLRSWYNGPGPLYLRTNRVMCPWAWRNWLSVGTTSSRFAAPPFLPPPVWFTVSRAFIFEDKPCKKSLGLEPSLRASSLYANSIIRVGRNASAFLGNAAGKHRLRTAWGSVHGIINKRQQRLRNLLFTGGKAAVRRRMRGKADIPLAAGIEERVADRIGCLSDTAEPSWAFRLSWKPFLSYGIPSGCRWVRPRRRIGGQSI